MWREQAVNILLGAIRWAGTPFWLGGVEIPFIAGGISRITSINILLFDQIEISVCR